MDCFEHMGSNVLDLWTEDRRVPSHEIGKIEKLKNVQSMFITIFDL